MSSHLTYADVQKLLQEPSPAVREETAKKLSAEIDDPNLTEQELALAYDIIKLMAKDVETSVRQALSYNLRNANRLPHDIALKLANDIEAVALPILEHSHILADEDLIEIVGKGSAAKQQAIASRSGVSEKLSEKIITTAGEDAVTKLMKNKTAHISSQGFGKALQRFEANEAVKTAMVLREALPITIAEQLSVMVSAQLQDYLVSHHELSPEVASDIVLQSRERAIINFTMGEDEGSVEKLVLQMHKNRRLTSSIVLRALCTGDIAFFETALAVMANIPLVNARLLIHDSGRLALTALCEKAKIKPELFEIIRVALGVVHETTLDGEKHDHERYRARVIERILTQVASIDSADLQYLLKKLDDVIQLSVS